MSLGMFMSCPCCGASAFKRSPTYNLAPMWRAAGLDWKALEGKTGEEIGPTIRAALDLLRAEPARFKQLNPPNGWGSYDNLVDVLAALLECCEQHGGHVLTLSP